MKSYEFAFAIGEDVQIQAIARPGRIDAVTLDICGPQFRVVYWADGKRESVWLYEYEIEAVKKQGDG